MCHSDGRRGHATHLTRLPKEKVPIMAQARSRVPCPRPVGHKPTQCPGERGHATLLDFSVYLLVRFIVCVVQILSWEGALRLAGWLATLAYHYDRRRHQV